MGPAPGARSYDRAMTWFRRRREASSPAREQAPRNAKTTWSEPENPEWARPDRWRLSAWDQPDLTRAKEHAAARYESWDRYVPRLELVRCGDEVKPALFFKIGCDEYAEWTEAVDPVTMGWNWYRTKGEAEYVVIELYVLFANHRGTAIGVGGAGRTAVMTAEAHRYSHQLRSRALLDSANAARREAIGGRALAPAPTMLFFVGERFGATSYVSTGLGPEQKQDLLRALDEATGEIESDGIATGGFADACALLKESLPGVSYWRD